MSSASVLIRKDDRWMMKCTHSGGILGWFPCPCGTTCFEIDGHFRNLIKSPLEQCILTSACGIQCSFFGGRAAKLQKKIQWHHGAQFPPSLESWNDELSIYQAKLERQMMRLKKNPQIGGGPNPEGMTKWFWKTWDVFWRPFNLRTMLLTMKSTPCSWIYHRWDNVRIPNLLKNTFCWNIGLKHQFYTVVLTSKNPTVWTFLCFPLSKTVSISTCKPSSFKKFKWLMNPSIFFP